MYKTRRTTLQVLDLDKCLRREDLVTFKEGLDGTLYVIIIVLEDQHYLIVTAPGHHFPHCLYLHVNIHKQPISSQRNTRAYLANSQSAHRKTPMHGANSQSAYIKTLRHRANSQSVYTETLTLQDGG